MQKAIKPILGVFVFLVLFFSFAPEDRVVTVLSSTKRIFGYKGELCLQYHRYKLLNPESGRLTNVQRILVESGDAYRITISAKNRGGSDSTLDYYCVFDGIYSIDREQSTKIENAEILREKIQEKEKRAIIALAGTGVDVKDINSILRLSAEGNITIEESAASLINLMVLYHLSVNDLSHLVDVVLMAKAISNATTQDILESLMVANTPSLENVSLEFFAAAVATMIGNDPSLRGGSAGQYIRNISDKLINPSKSEEDMFISTGTFPWIDLKKNRLATLPEKFHWVSRTVSVYSNQSALLYLTDILGKTNSLAAKALFHSYSPLFSTALEKINNIKNRE